MLLTIRLVRRVLWLSSRNLTKKLQMKILLGKCHIAVRKCKGNSRSINAGQLKQHGALDTLIRHDEGYKFLNALRGSPPYFEKAKKDLFAMIRQLGPATLFCSFSSAETQWVHLLRILGQLVDNTTYTDEQIENFNWEDRCRLIQSDPVTCARHFDYQINQFLTHFLLSSSEPLGKNIRLVLSSRIPTERITSYSHVDMDKRCTTISNR